MWRRLFKLLPIFEEIRYAAACRPSFFRLCRIVSGTSRQRRESRLDVVVYIKRYTILYSQRGFEAKLFTYYTSHTRVQRSIQCGKQLSNVLSQVFEQQQQQQQKKSFLSLCKKFSRAADRHIRKSSHCYLVGFIVQHSTYGRGFSICIFTLGMSIV